VRCVGLLLLAGACATAGQPTGAPADADHTDAAPTVDSPRQIDAPLPIDAPQQDLCASGATCAAAMDLGSVSGDDGPGSVTASGYQSAWYKVRVTEDDSDPFADDLKVLVQLTSPPGTNYDVFVYMNTGSDVVDCTTVAASGTSTGTLDQAHVTWGETGTFSNGNDDGRTVSIEVRPVSGPCSASAPYQLVVFGDQ
jgi:hypothetical protein